MNTYGTPKSLTETQIFRELSIWIKDLSNSIKEFVASIREIFNSNSEFFIQLESYLYMYN